MASDYFSCRTKHDSPRNHFVYDKVKKNTESRIKFSEKVLPRKVHRTKLHEKIQKRYKIYAFAQKLAYFDKSSAGFEDF